MTGITVCQPPAE